MTTAQPTDGSLPLEIAVQVHLYSHTALGRFISLLPRGWDNQQAIAPPVPWCLLKSLSDLDLLSPNRAWYVDLNGSACTLRRT
jgi:hypothetical protein